MAAAGDAGEQLLLHLKLAFLALEPPACVLTLARKAGGGSVTPHVQNFILENCIHTNVGGDLNNTYVETILKKVIAEAELSADTVIDGLYEELGQCMLSKANNSLLNMANKIYKDISFLSPTHDNASSNPVSLVARLSCSTNMLEGDTGCCLWPSSLFLSEFILSFPELFSKKCCFELGSGVGLVGVCLNYVGASKVILTDGDASTLTNMKANMEMNSLYIEDSQLVTESKNKDTIRNKVSHLMALLKTKNAMGLFVVATVIMSLVMSPCFGQGGDGVSCLVVCVKLPGCTLDKCQHSCVTRGITNFTATCGDFEDFSCCCKYECKRVPPI